MRPLPTEPVTFPALCLAGRLPEQQNATVNLDLTHAQVSAVCRLPIPHGCRLRPNEPDIGCAGSHPLLARAKLHVWDSAGDIVKLHSWQWNYMVCCVQHAPGGGASADVTAWPEFHNGVATGEALLQACHGGYTHIVCPECQLAHQHFTC